MGECLNSERCSPPSASAASRGQYAGERTPPRPGARDLRLAQPRCMMCTPPARQLTIHEQYAGEGTLPTLPILSAYPPSALVHKPRAMRRVAGGCLNWERCSSPSASAREPQAIRRGEDAAKAGSQRHPACPDQVHDVYPTKRVSSQAASNMPGRGHCSNTVSTQHVCTEHVSSRTIPQEEPTATAARSQRTSGLTRQDDGSAETGQKEFCTAIQGGCQRQTPLTPVSGYTAVQSPLFPYFFLSLFFFCFS